MSTNLNMASVNKIKDLVEKQDYKAALAEVSSIDVEKSLNPQFMRLCGEVYAENKKFDDARKILISAHILAPRSSEVLSELIKLYLKMGYFSKAKQYYSIYTACAPKEGIESQTVLYNIKKAMQAPDAELIAILEEICKQEYVDVWAFELALLYRKAGMNERSVQECDRIMKSFSQSSIYVKWARPLKMGSINVAKAFNCYPKEEKQESSGTIYQAVQDENEQLRKDYIELFGSADGEGVSDDAVIVEEVDDDDAISVAAQITDTVKSTVSSAFSKVKDTINRPLDEEVEVEIVEIGSKEQDEVDDLHDGDRVQNNEGNPWLIEEDTVAARQQEIEEASGEISDIQAVLERIARKTSQQEMQNAQEKEESSEDGNSVDAAAEALAAQFAAEEESTQTEEVDIFAQMLAEEAEQMQQAAEELVSAEQMQQAAEELVSAEQMQQAAEEPVGAEQMQQAAEEPVSAEQMQQAAEEPVSAEQMQQVVEEPVSAEQMQQAAEEPVSAEQMQQVVEEPVSAEQMQQVVEELASAEQMQQVVEEPVSAEQMQQVVEEPVSAEQMQQAEEEPASAEQMQQVAEEPVSAEQMQQVAEEPVSAEQMQQVAEEPVSAEQMQQVVEEPVMSQAETQGMASEDVAETQEEESSDVDMSMENEDEDTFDLQSMLQKAAMSEKEQMTSDTAETTQDVSFAKVLADDEIEFLDLGADEELLAEVKQQEPISEDVVQEQEETDKSEYQPAQDQTDNGQTQKSMQEENATQQEVTSDKAESTTQQDAESQMPTQSNMASELQEKDAEKEALRMADGDNKPKLSLKLAGSNGTTQGTGMNRSGFAGGGMRGVGGAIVSKEEREFMAQYDQKQAEREAAAKERALRAKREEALKEQAKKEQAERDRLLAEAAARETLRRREEEERQRRIEEEQRRVEEARLEAERKAREAEEARLEEERKAREAEEARIEAERRAQEAKLEAERMAKEAEERAIREAEERARREEEERIRREAEEEERRRLEAERIEKERQEREARLAEEARKEAERIAREAAEQQRLKESVDKVKSKYDQEREDAIAIIRAKVQAEKAAKEEKQRKAQQVLDDQERRKIKQMPDWKRKQQDPEKLERLGIYLDEKGAIISKEEAQAAKQVEEGMEVSAGLQEETVEIHAQRPEEEETFVRIQDSSDTLQNSGLGGETLSDVGLSGQKLSDAEHNEVTLENMAFVGDSLSQPEPETLGTTEEEPVAEPEPEMEPAIENEMGTVSEPMEEEVQSEPIILGMTEEPEDSATEMVTEPAQENITETMENSVMESVAEPEPEKEPAIENAMGTISEPMAEEVQSEPIILGMMEEPEEPVAEPKPEMESAIENEMGTISEPTEEEVQSEPIILGMMEEPEESVAEPEPAIENAMGTVSESTEEEVQSEPIILGMMEEPEEPATKMVTEPAQENITETMENSVMESATEPEMESAIENEMGTISEPMEEEVQPEPIILGMMEEPEEPATEMVTEPVQENITETMEKSVMESATEPEKEPAIENDMGTVVGAMEEEVQPEPVQETITQVQSEPIILGKMEDDIEEESEVELISEDNEPIILGKMEESEIPQQQEETVPEQVETKTVVPETNVNTMVKTDPALMSSSDPTTKVAKVIEGVEFDKFGIPILAEKYIGKYVAASAVRKQFRKPLENVIRKKGVYRNIVVLSRKGCTVSNVAIDFARSYHELGLCKTKVVATIKAKMLNKTDMQKILPKLQGGCLIIEQAGELSREKALEVFHIVSKPQNDVVLMLVGEVLSVTTMFGQNSELNSLFHGLFLLHDLSDFDLTDIAIAYMKEHDYDADVEGMRALKKRIADLEHNGIDNVLAIVDSAIAKAEKRSQNSLSEVVFLDDYENSGLNVLKEFDFE